MAEYSPNNNIPESPQEKKYILPDLTAEQEEQLGKIADPVDRAHKIIDMLHLKVNNNSEPNEQLSDALNELDREAMVSELCWNLKQKCEEWNSPLFNMIESSILLSELYPEYTPPF